jgi:hypothetical protein
MSHINISDYGYPTVITSAIGLLEYRLLDLNSSNYRIIGYRIKSQSIRYWTHKKLSDIEFTKNFYLPSSGVLFNLLRMPPLKVYCVGGLDCTMPRQ